jgi:hypothetical protein
LPRRRHLVGEGESGDEAGPPLAPGGAARLGVANRPPKKNSADTETDGTVSADTDKESDASSSTESGAAGGVEGDKEVLGPTTVMRRGAVGLPWRKNSRICKILHDDDPTRTPPAKKKLLHTKLSFYIQMC